MAHVLHEQQLPDDEQWSHRILVYLRRETMRDLRAREPCTARELIRQPPEVLRLPLNDAEIRALLDSARRQGLIQMVSDGRDIDGRPITPEWVLTDHGRRDTWGFGRWTSQLAGRIGRPALTGAGLLLGILTLLGITLSLHKLSSALNSSAAQSISSYVDLALFGVVLSTALFWLVQSGVTNRRKVVEEWARYRRDCPDWYAQMARDFPWAWAIAGASAFLGVDALLVERATRVITLPATVSGLPYLAGGLVAIQV